MVNFKPHLRITATGRLGTPEADRFSYGLNMDAPDPSWLNPSWIADHFVPLEDLADDVAAFHGRADTHIASAAVLDTVKIAHIHADGSYGGTNPFIKQFNVGGGGSQAGTERPQDAVAISLGTGKRGASYRGRFFIPLPNVPSVSTDGFRMPIDRATEILGSALTLIRNLNNMPGFDTTELTVVVSSTKGFNTAVTEVRVGRIVDTIRSRRNKLQEAYVGPTPVAV